MSENIEPVSPQKPLWQFPWLYRESFICAAGIMLVGYLLQWTQRRGINGISYPYNVIVLCSTIAVLCTLHFFARYNQITKWLRSVPAAISSIIAVLVQAIVLGTVPQKTAGAETFYDPLGFHSVMNSWPFVLCIGFLLVNVGLITLHRSFPFKWKNWGFIANHLGLWIALTAGMLGAGDLQRYSMNLYKGKEEWRATAMQGTNDDAKEMPFAFRLQKFDMETYAPKITIADPESGNIEIKKNNALRMVVKGDKYALGKYELEILDYIESAKLVNDKFYPVNEMGTAPAALVRIKDNETKKDTTCWLSCGSFSSPPAIIPMKAHEAIVMMPPDPKRYSSQVEVFTQTQEHYTATIEVNKPITVAGWKIYQLSYDEKMGKWSPLSVVECVKDPWLPLVYAGIFLMIVGGVYIMFKK